MLEHIHIKDFLVVDNLSIECHPNFSVITGETGAGKSIWVDAIYLALGHRADPSMIRQTKERACITLSFDITKNTEATKWLDQNDYETEDSTCIIKRSFSRDGRSKASINGYPVTLGLLKKLAPLLILIHSQQKNRELLKPTYQRQSLDSYSNNNNLLLDINNIYQQWQECQNNISSLQLKLPQREQQLDLLKYQIEELQLHNFQPNEWQILSTQHQKMHHAQQIKNTIHQALTLTTEHEDHAADTSIQQAQQALESLPIKDEQIDSIQELLNTANIHLQEASNELQNYYQTVNINQADLSDIENRISTMHDISRKHHSTPEAIHEVASSLQQQIDELEQAESKLQNLLDQQQKLANKYHLLATKLHNSRAKHKQTLSLAITKHMQELAMANGVFTIQLTTDKQQISAHGYDQVDFYVQTNPGIPSAPLKDIVSGGELSRISLALQMQLASKQHTPTLIFDEVDTGISGKTAAIVGKSLTQLGSHTQVLCITHLPQVASKANHHYKIEKMNNNKNTHTEITQLNMQQRIDEIARLIGGTSITQTTRASAKELLCS